MSDHPVTYHSLKNAAFWFTGGFIVYLVGGYWISTLYIAANEVNLLLVLLIFLGVPAIVAVFGFYLGWRTKKRNLDYTPPNWEFKTVQLKLEEVENLSKQYNSRHRRLVANPNLWFYYLPIVLIVLLFTLPLYGHYVNSDLMVWIPILYTSALVLLHSLTTYGGWLSTSSKGSGDFRLPLLRETIDLARSFSNVIGVSHLRVVFEKAEDLDLEIYRNPRIVGRAVSIEENAYIECSTEELGSIGALLIRMYKTDVTPDVIWWWQPHDRNFRKYVGENEEGYYVKNPVPSRVVELGVKDVKLVLQNAIAILVMEWARIHGTNERLSLLMKDLNIDT
ncbi:MAG: hypothetical protein ACFFEF_14865 [Candidatus Thorarchaeota archaeon]